MKRIVIVFPSAHSAAKNDAKIAMLLFSNQFFPPDTIISNTPFNSTIYKFPHLDVEVEIPHDPTSYPSVSVDTLVKNFTAIASPEHSSSLLPVDAVLLIDDARVAREKLSPFLTGENENDNDLHPLVSGITSGYALLHGKTIIEGVINLINNSPRDIKIGKD